jgi:hypothetical protein
MDYYKMFTGSAAEAYGRWIAEQEALGAERMDSICERPNDACAEIICEHIKAHLRGEVVPSSWRERIEELIASVTHR